MPGTITPPDPYTVDDDPRYHLPALVEPTDNQDGTKHWIMRVTVEGHEPYFIIQRNKAVG